MSTSFQVDQAVSSCSARSPHHAWTADETRLFLSLMAGTETEPGYFALMKQKKKERITAMKEIASALQKQGAAITYLQADNKWKSLLLRYRTLEARSKSGYKPITECPFHAEMSTILGDRHVQTDSACAKPLSTSCAPFPIQQLAPDHSIHVECLSSSDHERSSRAFPAPSKRKRKRHSSPVQSDSGEDLELFTSSSGINLNEGSDSPAEERQTPASSGRSIPRTSDFLKWATEYQASQEAIAKMKMEAADRRHTEMMALLERLVSVIEKKYS